MEKDRATNETVCSSVRDTALTFFFSSGLLDLRAFSEIVVDCDDCRSIASSVAGVKVIVGSHEPTGPRCGVAEVWIDKPLTSESGLFSMLTAQWMTCRNGKVVEGGEQLHKFKVNCQYDCGIRNWKCTSAMELNQPRNGDG